VKCGREFLAGLILAGVGVFFALAMLEAGVRWLHLVPDRFWEPDPILGARLIAGRRGWWTQEDREFVVPVEINREGLRDVEHQYAKPAGVFRILVLGDSFVEAMHVPLASTFPRLLERQLDARRTAPRVEVISAGVSGYGTASELLYFEREGKRYQPDVVLLAFYPGNDVMNNSHILEDTLKPVYGPDGTLQKVMGDAPRQRETGWRGLLARSAAYHYFRQLLLLRHPQLAHTLIAHGLLRREALRTKPQRDGIPVDYGVYATAVPPEWQDAWNRTEWLLVQLQHVVDANGARLAVAVISSRDQVYPQWWEEVVAQHPPMRGRGWDLDAPQRRVETWCAEHGVPCVALSPLLRAAATRSAEPLHFHHDGHWSAAGHRLAASVLADFLQRHGLVPLREEGLRQ
jgi:hypothetical protein